MLAISVTDIIYDENHVIKQVKLIYIVELQGVLGNTKKNNE